MRLCYRGTALKHSAMRYSMAVQDVTGLGVAIGVGFLRQNRSKVGEFISKPPEASAVDSAPPGTLFGLVE